MITAADVIVVGAGLDGLTAAARALTGAGRSVIVPEATDRSAGGWSATRSETTRS